MASENTPLLHDDSGLIRVASDRACVGSVQYVDDKGNVTWIRRPKSEVVQKFVVYMGNQTGEPTAPTAPTAPTIAKFTLW